MLKTQDILEHQNNDIERKYSTLLNFDEKLCYEFFKQFDQELQETICSAFSMLVTKPREHQQKVINLFWDAADAGGEQQ